MSVQCECVWRECERAGAPGPLACVPVCLSVSERRLRECVLSVSKVQ